MLECPSYIMKPQEKNKIYEKTHGIPVTRNRVFLCYPSCFSILLLYCWIVSSVKRCTIVSSSCNFSSVTPLINHTKLLSDSESVGLEPIVTLYYVVSVIVYSYVFLLRTDIFLDE